ncbi:S41 family peptidase [Lacticaseibacillus mingshuiensis]|uniref:S41 family peptidase n=1 Tax=Lacticaseibacillus mingshuiensis TaxID=2799574 RepID=UPI0019502BC6|nr:S41 family peptidase [Lacticaseibacillus mingshuiensis]
MADKKKHRSIQIPAWLLGVGLAGGLAAGGVIGYAVAPVTQQQAATVVTGVPKELQSVVTTYATIQASYYKNVKGSTLANGAISGMLSSLNDPWSELLVTDDKADLDSTLSATFGGIGATIQDTGKQLLIESIMPDTPAKKADLQVGDQLMAVDGASVVGKSSSEAVAKIRGKVGTKVKVTIKRHNKLMTIEMTRAKITTDTVASALSPENKKVGVITIATFSEPTANQFEEAVKKLRKEGATSFVIDLRGNPGGELTAALSIASMCLKDGKTIVQIQQREGDPEIDKASEKLDGGFKVTEPLAVLIDGNSASASEILSAALNESAGVPLIGQQSYGKGLVQNVASLSKSAEIKLTIAKWLTPDGNWINKKGLTPTKKVAYPAYATINAISATSLKPEDESSDVRNMQQILTALGYFKGTTNGFYGPTTESAVKAFQKAEGLTQTGLADQKTITQLMGRLSAKFQSDDPMMKAAVELAGKE